ncbi:MAG: hypothetical protein GX939_06650 [Clostridiaceae bacterium]|jgi:hypothetical protein|nr:hypothetical protein [Clostridiaceae bacterium]
MFRNIQYAADWLPKTIYIGDYWDSNTIAIADFKEDVDPFSASLFDRFKKGNIYLRNVGIRMSD